MHSASKRSGAGFQMRTVVIMPILWLCRVCKSKGHGNKRSKGKGKWAPGGWRPHIIDRGSGLREPSDSDPDSISFFLCWVFLRLHPVRITVTTDWNWVQFQTHIHSCTCTFVPVCVRSAGGFISRVHFRLACFNM